MAEADDGRCRTRKQSGGSWRCLREDGHEGNHYFVGNKSKETEPAYEEILPMSPEMAEATMRRRGER